jgi:hypothetical protein
MKKYGAAFAPLGSFAEITRGTTTGCDAFFLPFDVSKDALSDEKDEFEFKRRFRCQRAEVEDKTVRIIRAGDGSEHPIEAEFLMPVFVPEDHLKTIAVTDEQLVQRTLWISKGKSALKGAHVLRYLIYGEHETFGEGQVVPEKPTCKARVREWYDLTDSVGTRLLMPKGQQYGNIVFCASEPMLCNSRVYNVVAPSAETEKPLCAILNSTLAALWRCLYGRALGREGAADIMVVDVKMMPIPDPRKASKRMLKRLTNALNQMAKRQIEPFLETSFAKCTTYKEAENLKDSSIVLPPELASEDRRELDDAVLELIGIDSERERVRIRERLYQEIALFYRQVRLLELQAIENKKRAKKGRVASPHEVAAEIFSGPEIGTIRCFPDSFLPVGEPLESIELPEGKAKLFDPHDFYDAKSLGIGKTKITLRHRPQAELAKLYCDLHRTGFVQLPVSEESCERVRHEWERYLAEMQTVFRRLAAERSDDQDRQDAVISELNRLLVQ